MAGKLFLGRRRVVSLASAAVIVGTAIAILVVVAAIRVGVMIVGTASTVGIARRVGALVIITVVPS
jgi:hypothetical protein